MQAQKKEYLKLYLLQEAKISRLRQMGQLYPDRKAECNAQIAEALKLREEIEQKIKAVDEPLLSEFLYQKYILGKTLEELGYIFNYSIRHIERIHNRALEKFKL